AAMAIVASWSEARLDRWSRAKAPLTSALDLFFAPAPDGPVDLRPLGVSLAILAAFAYGIGAVSRIIDWDFLLQKVGVVVLWIATFDRVARSTPRLRLHAGYIAAGCLLPLLAWSADARVQKRMPE